MIKDEKPFGNGKTKYCTQCGYKLIENTVSADLPKYKYRCTNCGREFLRNDTYDYVANAVRSYWKRYYPQEMIAFFYQKYEDDNRWEWRQELIECEGSENYEDVIFLNDFCEGQVCIKSLTVIPLEQILDYYVNTHDNLTK